MALLPSSHFLLIEKDTLHLLDILAANNALDLSDATAGISKRAKVTSAFNTVGHVSTRPGDTDGSVCLANQTSLLLSHSWLVVVDFVLRRGLDEGKIGIDIGTGIDMSIICVGRTSRSIGIGRSKGSCKSLIHNVHATHKARPIPITMDVHSRNIDSAQIVHAYAIDKDFGAAIGHGDGSTKVGSTKVGWAGTVVVVDDGVGSIGLVSIPHDMSIGSIGNVEVSNHMSIGSIGVVVVANNTSIGSIDVVVVAGDLAVRSIHLVVIARKLKIGFVEGLVVCKDFHGGDYRKQRAKEGIVGCLWIALPLFCCCRSSEVVPTFRSPHISSNFLSREEFGLKKPAIRWVSFYSVVSHFNLTKTE